jgi:hypothetical protein
MIFEKPNVLYFLFLLILPLLVHLFQLRKYKTTKFSNVALLERIQIQSRKSSRLKKWLVLAMRLLALIFIILAFAKPYIPNDKGISQDNEIVIYLDNSLSMQLPGQQQSLLEEAKQNLWEQLKDNQKFTLFTNTKTWRNVTKADIRADFFNIESAPVHLKLENLLLKAESLTSKPGAGSRLFLISDGFNFENPERLKLKENLEFIKVRPTSTENLSIASVASKTTTTQTHLEAKLESYTPISKDVTVSLYNDEKLIAKTKAGFDNSTTAYVDFDVTNGNFNKGLLELEADALPYDNKFFFSLNKDKKIEVYEVYSKETKNSFLASIYTSEKFNFKRGSTSNLDLSNLKNKDLLILNEIEDLNPILISQTKEFLLNGGSLIIIPTKNNTPERFIDLSTNFNIYQDRIERKMQMTQINFDHPLFANVFSEKIKNFDYPFTNSSLRINSKLTPILQYSNGQAFLAQKENIYAFSSALNLNTSNFTNSPLVVPVFYNIALQSNKSFELATIIGQKQLIDVSIPMKKDNVLKLVNEEHQVIPQQTKVGDKIQINTEFQPKFPGHYELKEKDSTLLYLSFNTNREESVFKPLDMKNLDKKPVTSISEAFESFREETKILELWIWMLIFASIFLLSELLILRFLN